MVGVGTCHAGGNDHLEGRIGGAIGLQVGGGLVDDVELAKEIDEAALRAGCARA